MQLQKGLTKLHTWPAQVHDVLVKYLTRISINALFCVNLILSTAVVKRNLGIQQLVSVGYKCEDKTRRGNTTNVAESGSFFYNSLKCNLVEWNIKLTIICPSLVYQVASS